jgi:hypothetical protein
MPVCPEANRAPRRWWPRVFEEAASGGRWDRPELHSLLNQLREGDTLVVWKLESLSRSLKGCKLPLFDREHRHNYACRAHDDADGGVTR